MDLLLNTPALNVYEQMALDEVLVRRRPQETTLRFYHWVPGPAVTFGYAQALCLVQKTVQEADGPYVRRPTGGGVVFHKDDLTFSLVFVSKGSPREIYSRFHSHVAAQMGNSVHCLKEKLSAEAYRPNLTQQASACFVRPVEDDLMAQDGHKVLGGALRRFGETVLYQGSLQLPLARTQPVYKRAIVQAVRMFLAVDLQVKACAPELIKEAKELALSCYQTDEWIRKF